MDDATVRIGVAVIAASAVIVAAVIGLWKERKSRRDILLSDLEILSKVQNQSLSKIALASSVDTRLLVLGAEDQLGFVLYFARLLVAFIVLGLLSAIIVGFLTDSAALWVLAMILLVVVLVAVPAITLAIKSKLLPVVHDQLRDKVRKEMSKYTREELLKRVRTEVAEKIEEEFDKKEVPDELRPFLGVITQALIEAMSEGIMTAEVEKLLSPSFLIPPDELDEHDKNKSTEEAGT